HPTAHRADIPPSRPAFADAFGRNAPMTTEALIVVTCGSCGTKLRLRVPDNPDAAWTGRCPKCAARLKIDLAPPATPSPTPAGAAATTTLSAAPPPIA